MATARRTTLTILAASAGLLLALTGCSAAAPAASHTPKPTHSAAAPSAAAQSTTAACAALQSSVATLTADLQQSFASLAADPNAAEQKLQQLTDSTQSGLDSVTNPEVKDAGTKAHDALAALTADVKAVLANPKTADTAKIQADATAVQTNFTALGKVCG
ncbi:MAG: hypothetical protein JWN36_3010 [Microbacteriaceae bacterium]|nr:hypothetical protein [Microbacteriaceae bacterium]